MKLEEAIVYLLASSGHGMKTEQIAREINERKLFERWDHEPVSGKQVHCGYVPPGNVVENISVFVGINVYLSP